jgi:selenocysteine lyase/cysteine desulfurase
MQNYRRFFPIVKHKVYLNHAATSPVSTKVKEALDEHYSTRMNREPGNWEHSMEVASELRTMFARMINAESGDRIAFTRNTTQGLNIIASGLKWKEGDEILIPEKEFPANVFPFKNLEKRGVKIKFMPTPGGGLDPATLKSNITEKTRLLTLSFVEFLSGYKHDMETIGRICRDEEIIFIVDSIQGLGAIPLDVKKFHIDGLANGGHKWLMAPPGTGFLYITRELQDRINQVHMGWTGLENFEDFLDYDRKPVKTAARYELGSLNFAGITGAHASLSLLIKAGIEDIYQHLIDLTNYAIRELKSLGFNIFTNENLKYRSGIITFYPDQGAPELFELLQDHNIVCSLRSNMIRIAPHFYNNQDDIKRLLEVCKRF